MRSEKVSMERRPSADPARSSRATRARSASDGRRGRGVEASAGTPLMVPLPGGGSFEYRIAVLDRPTPLRAVRSGGGLAKRARHDEADPGALLVDRAGLVVDQ